MSAGRAPPGDCYPLPPRHSHPPAACDDAGVSDPARRDPAWLWYGLATLVLIALLVLDLIGALDPLGP